MPNQLVTLDSHNRNACAIFPSYQKRSESLISENFCHQSVFTDARDPTRLIVAGLAQSIGSIPAPFTRYSIDHHKIMTDHRYASIFCDKTF
jgi:hypothetical protein